MSHYNELMSVPPFPHTMYTHTASSSHRLQRRWWEKPSLHWPLQSTGSVSKRLAGWFPALACVLVCEQERERENMCMQGIISCSSLCVYICMCVWEVQSQPESSALRGRMWNLLWHWCPTMAYAHVCLYAHEFFQDCRHAWLVLEKVCQWVMHWNVFLQNFLKPHSVFIRKTLKSSVDLFVYVWHLISVLYLHHT